MKKLIAVLAIFLALSLATEANAMALPPGASPTSPHFPAHFPTGGALDEIHWFIFTHGSSFGLNWGSNWLHTHIHGGETPLPAALPLFGVALAGLAVYRRRKKS